MQLTDKERAELRELLLDLIKDLGGRVDQLALSSQPVDLDEPIGRLSRIDAIAGQHMAMSVFIREQQRLEDAKHALRQLDSADFGTCPCGRDIGIDRLRFQPEVFKCTRCAR